MTFEQFKKKLPITYKQLRSDYWSAHLPTVQVAVVSKVAGNNYLITYQNVVQGTDIVGSAAEADNYIRHRVANFFVDSLHTVKEQINTVWN